MNPLIQQLLLRLMGTPEAPPNKDINLPAERGRDPRLPPLRPAPVGVSGAMPAPMPAQESPQPTAVNPIQNLLRLRNMMP